MSHSTENHAAHAHEHHEGPHIVPVATFRTVLYVLLGLTFITVIASARVGGLHIGNWAIALAMVIASIKALFVALVFMHLKYENPLTWLYAIFPMVLLALLIGGVYLDAPTRYVPEPVKVQAAAK
jgi:cytochrome c oxidase subunit IV